MPLLFDFDLKRVSRERYIAGKASINFPHPGSTTGGWHFLSYFDRKSGVATVLLAGIHYPDTTSFFGDEGIAGVTEQLADRGWSIEGRRQYMADHYRAAADMIVKWALSDSAHCNVEIDNLVSFPVKETTTTRDTRSGKPKLFKVGRLLKVEAWLSSQ